jgi:hypothetical protein
MSAGSLSVRSSTEDQKSGRSRVTLNSGSIPGPYCVGRDQTVKVVRPDLLGKAHVCSTPSGAGSKQFRRGRDFLTSRTVFPRFT